MSTAPSLNHTFTAGTRAQSAQVNNNFTQIITILTDEQHSLSVSGIKSNRLFSDHTSTDLTVNVGDNQNLFVSSHEIASGTAYNVTTTGKIISGGTLTIAGTLNLNGDLITL